MIDIIKDLTYTETKEYFQDKTDTDIFNLFNGSYKIELNLFIKLVLCIKNRTKRYKRFFDYAVFYDNFNLLYFLNNFNNDDLITLGYDFLKLLNINNNSLRAIFTVLTNNKKLILDSFNSAHSLEDKLEYIKNVHLYNGKTTAFEELLISKLDDQEVVFLLNSNSHVLNETKKQNTSQLDIDSDITFGIELELINDSIHKFINIPCLMGDFAITKDASVAGGLEVVSPILHYTENDINHIKALCDILTKTNFTTDDTCSFHVHVGASYLKTKEDYLRFLYLYFNTEDIIYKITDRPFSQKRLSISKYASKLKDDLKTNFKDVKMDSKDEIISSLKRIGKTRYRGLNLQNINNKSKNTIEFRMSNGELDFDELLANIRLFLKMIEISHQIEQDKDKYALFVMLGKCPNERRRLDIFLALLFTKQSDRDIYLERYEANQHIIEVIEGKTTEDDNLLKIENQKLILNL